MTQSFTGGDTLSTQATEPHEKAAEQYVHAARHSQEATEYHQVGHDEQAAHHAHTARGHHEHGTDHASEAAKSHAEH
jgi:hypothetical protein